MKVLHVYKTYLPEDFTGVPRVIHTLATGMMDAGVSSHVLALHGAAEAELAIDRHFVHLARRNLDIASTGLSVSAFGMFRKLSAEADVIHYHFPWPMADLLHLSVRPQGKTVVTYHSDIVKQRRLLALYRPLRNRFLHDVDHIVATSPNYVESSRILHRFTNKLSVIPIGLPDAPAPDPELKQHWRRRVGEGFFLFVGAMRYYKGLQFLMEASRFVDAPVVIAGAGDAALWAAQAGPRVSFVGAITDADKSALLSLCRAFVFPSHLRSEAFGLSLVEAARAGRPMITAEIGTGTSFVNVDRVTGLVVPPEDGEALAAAMRQLAGDDELVAALGRSARERYDTVLRAETMVAAYLNIYRS